MRSETGGLRGDNVDGVSGAGPECTRRGGCGGVGVTSGSGGGVVGGGRKTLDASGVEGIPDAFPESEYEA